MPWTMCGACTKAAFITEQQRDAGSEAYCSPECARVLALPTLDEVLKNMEVSGTLTRTVAIALPGELREYRRGNYSDGLLRLESRKLNLDGRPVADWRPVDADHLEWLMRYYPLSVKALLDPEN